MFKGFMSDTKRFIVQAVIYKTEDFIVAVGQWEDPHTHLKSIEVACRWTDYPQTYGKPQWMLIPTFLGNIWKAGLTIANIFNIKS